MARKKKNDSIPYKGIRLRVATALGCDVGLARARIDPDLMEELGVFKGDLVEVTGKRPVYCHGVPAYTDMRGKALVQVDGTTRDNIGALLDEVVSVRKAEAREAEVVCILPMTTIPDSRHMQHIKAMLAGLPILSGSRIRIPLFGGKTSDFLIESTFPQGPVAITPGTLITLSHQEPRLFREAPVSYEDIGGIGRNLQTIREMAELPLRYPETFERLGIGVPRGIIIQGHSGCGKSLLARAIAHESRANFHAINGQELIHMSREDNESLLRRVFDEACHNTPSIIYIDELEAVAPLHDMADEAGRRMAAQLVTLMDSLKKHRNVLVIGATDNPEQLDEALCRYGRFDREINIPVPDLQSRLEMLQIHTRGMPLAKDMDLKCLARATRGFVGGNIAALCREASINCLSVLLDEMSFTTEEISYERFSKLEVTRQHFHAAMQEIQPSAIREAFVEIPEVRWTDIGGMESIKQRLEEAVQWPHCHIGYLKQACVSTARCILLCGPAGCGKTMLAKAVAAETLVNFITVGGPALLARPVEEAGAVIREVFRKARRAAPCIVFFDEIDAIVASRGAPSHNDYSVAKQLFSQFLVELDSLGCTEGLIVIAATNHPELLDAVLNSTRRFHDIIHVPLPDEADRLDIFRVCLNNRPTEPGLDIGSLAVKTKGFTGAQICTLCDKAAMRAVRRAVQRAEDLPDLRHLPMDKLPEAIILYDDLKNELTDLHPATSHD
jgi:transitional endoplasmic reticulum ATPase